MRALVVDDSKAIRMIISRLLTDLDHEAVQSEDGVDALQKLTDSGPFDLVLLDWNMPLMSGIEVVQKIRANPAWSDVQIVMVTTEAHFDRVRAAMDAGANEYLMKPFTREALVEKLALLRSVGS